MVTCLEQSANDLHCPADATATHHLISLESSFLDCHIEIQLWHLSNLAFCHWHTADYWEAWWETYVYCFLLYL